jgi:hypothetical protein
VSETTGNPSKPPQMVTRSPMPPVAGVESAPFAFLVPNLDFWPRPRLVARVGRAAVEPAAAVGRPARVRDRAVVGMIRPAGPASPAAEVLAEEIQALDEHSGMRWAPPEDTPGRIGPFNPGIRRDRSGP